MRCCGRVASQKKERAADGLKGRHFNFGDKALQAGGLAMPAPGGCKAILMPS
jgi:hypothetical protein